jgi:TM2 domain-containing membrane protein YozV
MKKFIKLSFLAIALAVSTVSSTNAAFPKDNVVSTKEITVIAPVTNEATVTTTTLTKAEAKKQAKEFKKANNWYAGGSKSKIVAALLAFFLGGLGIHSFYMGNKKKGLIQLGGTVLGMILLIAGFAKSVSAVAAVGTTAAVTASVSPLVFIGAILLFGVSIWAFVDFIRILTGGLAPEEGFND